MGNIVLACLQNDLGGGGDYVKGIAGLCPGMLLEVEVVVVVVGIV